MRISNSPVEIFLFGLCIAIGIAITSYTAFLRSSVEEMYEANRIDPAVFRAAGDLLAAGESPYLIENQRNIVSETRLQGRQPERAIPFSYPPNSLLLFRLRAIGDPTINSVIHNAVTTFLSLLVLSVLLFRYVPNQMVRLILIVMSATWAPALIDAILIQTGHLVAFFAILTLLLFRSNPILAGIALGLLAFKPQYAIPIGLVALSKQNWTLIVASAVTFFVTCLLSGLLYGFDMWLQFWQAAMELNITIPYMTNWLAAAVLIRPDLVNYFQVSTIPLYGLSMAVLGILLWHYRRNITLLGATSIAVMTAIIFSPNTHPYDLMLILIPAIYITRYFNMHIGFTVALIIFCLPPNINMWVSLARFLFLSFCLALTIWIIRHEIINKVQLNELPSYATDS